MKKQLTLKNIILAVILLFNTNAFCDTIDFYHVYYNDKIIEQFNIQNLVNPKIIYIDSIQVKNTDSIKVKYYTDTPWSTGKIYLTVYRHNYYKSGYTRMNIGTGNFLTFSLNDLLYFNRRFNINDFEVQYFDEREPYHRTLFLLDLNDKTTHSTQLSIA